MHGVGNSRGDGVVSEVGEIFLSDGDDVRQLLNDEAKTRVLLC
jgi:hypothetical protein